MGEDKQFIIRRFRERFTFGLNSLISLSISLILFFLAFTHPLNTGFWDGHIVWAGYARPDLMYVGSILLGVIGLHSIWLLWREGKLKPRGSRFALHALGAFVGAALTVTFLSSWYFNETHKWLTGYVPVSPGAPSQIITMTMLLLISLLLFTLPLHGIHFLYNILLERTLQHSDASPEKPKRDEEQGVVGDDGELLEWVEDTMRTKRLS